jgi:hypothetical protein
MPPADIARVCALIDHLWPGKTPEWTDDLVDVWAAMLASVDVDVTLAVVADMARLSEYRAFPPTVGAIAAAAADAVDPIPSVDQAWDEVIDQLHSVGTYGDPRFTHPAIAEAVRAFGWRNLCQSEAPGVDRAHFLRLWPSVADRHRRLRDMPMADKELIAERRVQRALGGPSGVVVALEAFVATTRELDEAPALSVVPERPSDPMESCERCGRKGWITLDDGAVDRCPACRPASQP